MVLAPSVVNAAHARHSAPRNRVVPAGASCLEPTRSTHVSPWIAQPPSQLGVDYYTFPLPPEMFKGWADVDGARAESPHFITLDAPEAALLGYIAQRDPPGNDHETDPTALKGHEFAIGVAPGTSAAGCTADVSIHSRV